jgi:hypothetical protein
VQRLLRLSIIRMPIEPRRPAAFPSGAQFGKLKFDGFVVVREEAGIIATGDFNLGD